MDFPYYQLVPKDFGANLKFRHSILEEAKIDPKAQQEFYDMCSRDVLFYVNTFLYTIDPRNADQPIVPFLTYEYQDEAMSDIMEIFGKDDILFEKSRDMGATWINLIPIEWHWHFSPSRLTFLLVSRKSEYVYMKGDEKALFSKIDMMHEYLPSWLQPQADRKEMHYRNSLTGSTIDGEATTGDVGRGDRRTVIFMDEFAAVEVKDGHRANKSTRATTACRIFNSTYQGTNNAFYELATETDIKKILLDIAKEEKTHVGEFQTLLLERDKQQVRELEEGRKEVEEELAE